MCEARTTPAAPVTFPTPQPRLQTGQHKQSNSQQVNQECSQWFVCDAFRGQVRARRLCPPVTHRRTAPWSQLSASIATVACLLVRLISFSGARRQRNSRARGTHPRWGKAHFCLWTCSSACVVQFTLHEQKTKCHQDSDKHLVPFLHAATFEFRVFFFLKKQPKKLKVQHHVHAQREVLYTQLLQDCSSPLFIFTATSKTLFLPLPLPLFSSYCSWCCPDTMKVSGRCNQQVLFFFLKSTVKGKKGQYKKQEKHQR